MDKYYVLVAGSGTSSRANIEALIEDHVYANGQDVTFVLPFKDKISQGQIFLAQLAKDKSKDLVVFANEGADLSNAPSSSFSPSETPLKDAIKFISGSKAWVFLLWNDEDAELVMAVNECSDAGLKVFDLTDGLNVINRTEPITILEPVIPEAEKTKPSVQEILFEEEDLDEEDLENELIATVFSLVDVMSDIVTKRVLDHLDRFPPNGGKKPSKGSEA